MTSEASTTGLRYPRTASKQDTHSETPINKSREETEGIVKHGHEGASHKVH